MRASFETVVPGDFHAGILALCKKVGTNTAPQFVDVCPDPDSAVASCFLNVQRKIARDGGCAQHGWILWEALGVLIEAEFHSVWRNSEDRLICVSVRDDGLQRLAFLPDPVRPYEGRRVGNVAISWPKNRHVEKLLKKEAELFRYEERHFDPATGVIRCSRSTRDCFVREVEAAARKVKSVLKQ